MPYLGSELSPVLWSCPGMLKIHSGGSSSQQTVLTVPANQPKQLGVGTGTGGVQTIHMPVNKGKSVSPSMVNYSII